MDLSKELSCEAGSFSCCLNPHRFFQSKVLRLYFPALEPWVAWSVSLPSCSSWFIAHTCGTARSTSRLLAASPLCLAAHLCPSYCPEECFFFNSLVVGLPYSLIFWQFWLFFAFKFVVLFVMEGGIVCLHMPPSWLEVYSLTLTFRSLIH